MSSKSILLISSYTVSKLVRFLRHSVYNDFNFSANRPTVNVSQKRSVNIYTVLCTIIHDIGTRNEAVFNRRQINNICIRYCVKCSGSVKQRQLEQDS